MKVVLAYVTFANETEAHKICRHLLKKRLIGCANSFEMKSMYRWKGKVTHADEIACLLKTTALCFDQMKKEILRLHSYSTPCILRIPSLANEKYGKWIHSECKN